MSSLNRVILVGNLGRDPEVKRMASGDPVVTLSIATGESWKDKRTGERRERTEWHRVVIFNTNLCEIAEKYLRKGSKLCLEGQLQTRKWDDRGTERYSTEIVLQQFRGTLTLLGDPPGGRPARDEDTGTGTPAPATAQRSFVRDDFDDDAIPF